ncbi:putative alpha-l-rhamnosidase [Diplodia seriata]|uniref:Putative alpha-l-rhamnosidase n=1 Tax=Diplodia seriata TaxID=420778 RepID=A0A0G2DTK1_9PEZI|nr:putative alpha-l-rhamnosidase [Diplodia seriata]
MYNKIWALGVRSAQQACIASGSAPSTWEITNDGAFVRGQAPAQSSLGTEYGNYTLTFSTKIARGGTGWRVAASIQGYGQYFVLTSEYPEGTFLNTNRTLLPPSTLVANYGWSLVNQTTLETGPNVYYPLPFEVKEDKWYNITTTINATGYAVSIDGSDPIFVFNANGINSAPSTFSSGDKTSGTWGFGPFQDQQAYFTNVVVEAENGTVLYKSDLKGASVLEEHGVAANTHNVCLDGAKRDRLVWTGDYAHTQRIIAASTASTAFSTGTLAYALEWQAPNSSLYPNFSGMSASMGASPAVGGTARAGYALIDYQFLYLLAFADYHRATADSSFLATHYPQLRRLADSLAATLVDPATGLVSIPPSLPGIFFLGPSANATAPSALFAHALARAADLASAAAVAAASDESVPDALANETALSPNLSGFLLEALMVASREAAFDSSSSAGAAMNNSSSGGDGAATRSALSHLLDDLWPAMLTNDAYATGSSWEYVLPDGAPGLGPSYTSLAHPWGGAPTDSIS